MFLGDYMLDPPDDPPLTTCPDCDGEGEISEEVDDTETVSICPRCDGAGEAYLTDDEVREAAAEAMIARAEARRDDVTEDVPW